ncbi:hypothetical protein [Agrobacterium genomosp. 2]|uniref:Uncharacterized protein n=1 Tax=Agrobacterium genomosp. 2 str. CFBP 5494 TaxID=1183436 RepID=A0A9W5AZ50_9HYPH|nr:hypothetical protein [Agrobacterium genomosp. 2]CUW88100.1 conserved hypothetical protein [Agrobacterium genomosp. 2 str. CFBP 5494]
MTSIYFSDATVKSFSAATKGGKSTIKIEIETADRYQMASILNQLDEIEAEQKAAKAIHKAPAKKTDAPQLALPAPLKQISYHGDNHE